ncbi:MAG TPA: hypothetical protein VF278_04900, partial [Pirellulales bacterium]
FHRGKPGGGGAEQIRYGISARYRVKIGHFAQAKLRLGRVSPLSRSKLRFGNASKNGTCDQVYVCLYLIASN